MWSWKPEYGSLVPFHICCLDIWSHMCTYFSSHNLQFLFLFLAGKLLSQLFLFSADMVLFCLVVSEYLLVIIWWFRWVIFRGWPLKWCGSLILTGQVIQIRKWSHFWSLHCVYIFPLWYFMFNKISFFPQILTSFKCFQIFCQITRMLL